MPPKRKNEQQIEEPTAREKKKLKISAARTIAVQSIPQSISQNAAIDLASTSTLKPLPSAIDVEKFVEARAFEIDAMEKAMRTASSSSTQRAWQALPRHLRRRAASHDVRRVPLRLRDKARAEMDPVRKKILGRSMPKLGKDKRISRTEQFLKRQRDKSWLETHLWHAKRMKMENMWGYRLAVHPTEKAFRPSHRASIHGSILHDASYYSLIEVKGPEKALKAILEVCCDPQGQGPGAKRYLTGSRVLETHIYKPGSYPFGLVSPITVIWKPISSQPSSDGGQKSSIGKAQTSQKPQGSDASTATPKRKRQSKKKPQATDIADLHTVSEAGRTVWLRSHPAVFDDISSILRTAASLAVRSESEDDHSVSVEIADLRGQVNVFEIMGPKSNQVLKGALTPVAQDTREDFRNFWSSLTEMQTSGSVPRGMIIGFKVNDPRLKFPPKNAKPKVSGLGYVVSNITTFPTSELARSDIWDESIRSGLAKPRYTKKELDERRSNTNVVPGTPLNPLRQDDRIPVLLIQRSVENSGSSCDSEAIHGWTLIIPAGWAMPFFNSLTFTGTRVGGQRERQTQAFEAGTAYFPRDFLGTKAYDEYAVSRMKDEKERWDKKPPAKRVNYTKLETWSPWRADWDALIGLKNTYSHFDESEDFITTQRNDNVETETNVRPWLLRGSEVSSILSNLSKVFSHGAQLLSEMNRLRLKRGQNSLGPTVKAESLLKGAFILVRVLMCSRGAPHDLAAIYSVNDDEVRRWKRALQKKIKGGVELLGDEHPDEIELSEVIPPQESIIGYVTTGNFSLSRGEGFAIGALPVTRLLELQQQFERIYPNGGFKPSLPLVKVRNRESHQCRAAYLEIIDN